MSTAEVDEANLSIGIKSPNIVDAQLNEVKFFQSIPPSKMVELQKKCNQLSVIYEYVASNHKHKLSVIQRIRSKPIRCLLLQFDRLSLIRGVLHCRTFADDNEIQQLVLPLTLCESVLQSLHDDNGHQGLQRVIDLLCAKVYWPSMFADTDHWLLQCERCHIAKGDYTEPKTQQGTLTANQPLELLCIDSQKLILQRVERRIFLFSQMPFQNSVKPLSPAVKRLLLLLRFWLRNGLAFSVFLSISIVIRDGLLITRSFLTYVKCMAFANL